MEKQYDDTNRGVLWEPRGETIAKQGKVNVDGNDLNMIVIKKSIPSKDGGSIDILEPFISAGKIFKTDKTKYDDVEKAPDFQGDIATAFGSKYGFYRSRTDKNGNQYISLSLADQKEQNKSGTNSPIVSPEPGLISVPQTAEMDDEIPF